VNDPDLPVVRQAGPADAQALADIYNPYVRESTATFELDPVGARTMAERMAASPEGLGWFVSDVAGQVVGYASVSRWKPRGAYARTVETSIYLRHDMRGTGLATPLYGRLLDAIWAGGYHAALAGIALPNEASIRLHEALGFRPAGVLRQVGFKFGRWIDVGYWQALEPGAKGDP
jgi:phosphinothricin acetyltransferase